VSLEVGPVSAPEIRAIPWVMKVSRKLVVLSRKNRYHFVIYLGNGNLTALSYYKLSTQRVQYSLKICLCVSCNSSLLLYYVTELYCNAHQVS
jgi:hypothetical protein